LEKAFEQHDGFGPSKLAHTDSFVQVYHCQSVSLGESLHGLFDAMTVSMSLHDGPDFGNRPGCRLDSLVQSTGNGIQIVAQGRQRNRCENWTWHMLSLKPALV